MKSGECARIVALFSIVAGSWACSHSPAPAPEAVSATNPPPVASVDPIQSPRKLPAESAQPSAAPAPAAPAPQPGDITLPPASASAWNNAQSDGRKPSTDRGISDYQQIIASNRDKFRACYETSLGAHPGLRGQAVLKFALGPDGSVTEALLDRGASQILEPEFEKCMVRTVKSLTFPPSKRGMVSNVSYPFTFTPGARSASSSR